MRLNLVLIAAALIGWCSATAALGQTAVERFESKAKAPLTAVPKPATPAGDAADADASPYLGVTDDGDAAAPRGAGILDVAKGGPAEVGGLKAGDVITAIEGKPIRNWDDFDKAMATAKVGSRLLITVRRGLTQESKTVTLGRKPTSAASPPAAPPVEPPAAKPPPVEPPPAEPPPAGPPPLIPPADPAATPAEPDLSLAPSPALGAPADPLAAPPAADPGFDPAESSDRATLGVSIVPLNAETRVQYDLRTSARQGAIIHSVRPGSPADLAGLPIGGVIVSIDGQLVKSSDDLAAAITAARPGQEVELRYMTAGDSLATKNVRLAPAAAIAIVPAAPRPADDAGAPSNLRRFEDLAGSLATDVPIGSTIADPSRVAKIYEDVKAMKETITALEERIKLLEAKLSGAAPAVNP
jgi:membrane-associated protease RseP (regulator of RpoE activity)